MVRIGFMASHGGSGMKAVLQALNTELNFEPAVFIGNNPNAACFKIAQSHSIPVFTHNSKTHDKDKDLDQAICDTLQAHQVDLVLLSGYMKKIGPLLLSVYENRILNIHPSLLPKYGGQGMYGDRVHQAVIDHKEQLTGASIHIVTPEYDQGPVLKRAEVKVHSDDTVETVREKVKAIEGNLYVQTLKSILAGEIQLPGSNLSKL